MQTEKEFKELAQDWIYQEPYIQFEDIDRTIELILELMWRSYNEAIKDMNK
jgi:hypothetical protein